MSLQQRYRVPPPPAGDGRIEVCRRILALGLGRRLVVSDDELRWDVGLESLLGTRQLLRPMTWDMLRRISEGEQWERVL